MAERLFYQKLNKEEQQIIEEEYHLRLLSLWSGDVNIWECPLKPTRKPF